jgi:hypothetical protein
MRTVDLGDTVVRYVPEGATEEALLLSLIRHAISWDARAVPRLKSADPGDRQYRSNEIRRNQ